MPSRETLERLLLQLPGTHAPQLLYDRLIQNDGSIATLLDRDTGLFLDVLALAAWSPWLATTLEQNPEYVQWLQRERVNTRVRSREELGESLARFALTHSTIDPHDMFARFRRRELLRIYLHDIRRAHTVAETTEELSNLADAVLEYALRLARQRLDNRYGPPQRIDSEGRIVGSDFCIVALGKLGSLELNYASDIDLMFIFSHEGMTAAGGSHSQVTNREYYVKLAENVLKLVSAPTGEGAAYRIDVRLRPHGREGTLACSLDEAARYYQTTAQDWELQTLIRARSAAGSEQLFSHFAADVVDRIYRADVSVATALANVRLSKEKIDIQRERSEKGFNVKLGRGGIREIEFIAQALQLAFGGNDEWLRAPHTLISLARLADRGLVTEAEYSQLSDAYQFWRCLEHRLQMEHGLQTHSVPLDPKRRELIARRLNFAGENAPARFETAITTHAANVRAVFDRVFADAAEQTIAESQKTRRSQATIEHDPDAVNAAKAAGIFVKYLASHESESSDAAIRDLAEMLRGTAEHSLNSRRALSYAARIARSLDKENQPATINPAELTSMIRLCGASEPVGEMIAGRPFLLHSIDTSVQAIRRRVYAKTLRAAVSQQPNFSAEMDALRHAWSQAVIEIAAADAAEELVLNEVNERLTALATAAIDAALLIATNELARRYGELVAEPRVAILGLGRLGSGGMDYGSDLDVIAVYDSTTPAPVGALTHDEAYARIIELMTAALSNITREGSLYRVDLRLRPDGQKGPIVSSSDAFRSYLEQRAAIWEWLAYVKLHAVSGAVEFGAQVEAQARQSIHKLAQRTDREALRVDTSRVRARLEREKAPRRNAGINIKHGAGGMLDVYFAVRYLQLRDNVPDHESDRTTLGMLSRLRGAQSIDERHFGALSSGYSALRSVDHQMRLIMGRSATLPVARHPALFDIARRLGHATADALVSELKTHMGDIRAAYDRIMAVTPE